jgi:hypothetical protein
MVETKIFVFVFSRNFFSLFAKKAYEKLRSFREIFRFRESFHENFRFREIFRKNFPFGMRIRIRSHLNVYRDPKH